MSVDTKRDFHLSMKQGRSLFIYFLIVLVWVFPSYGKENNSCECPKLECNSCEEQTGLIFYSEKCSDGSNVRSCARPSCKLKTSLTSGCKVEKMQSLETKKTKVRQLASKMEQARGVEIGKIIFIKDIAWLEEAPGKQSQVFVGDSVHLKDLLITGKHAKVKVEFQDGNEVHIQPNSRVKIKKYDLKTRKRSSRVLLYLSKGKIRNKVKNQYKNNTSSYYRVKTNSAVIGVTGTDFVVTFKSDHKEVTKVETLKGEVKLANLESSQSIDVSKGERASYVVVAGSSDVFSDKEVDEFVVRGYMTPVHKMTAAEIRRLDWVTEVTNKRSQVANTKSKKKMKSVCQSPQGELNQCYWICQNNPKGEKHCRTDLPQVNCFRRRCNANGVWADEARLPASFHNQCFPAKVRVGTCDY